MSELRKDPVTGRWVIISTERRKRPSDFRLESVSIGPNDGCPFCEGREQMTGAASQFKNAQSLRNQKLKVKEILAMKKGCTPEPCLAVG